MQLYKAGSTAEMVHVPGVRVGSFGSPLSSRVVQLNVVRNVPSPKLVCWRLGRELRVSGSTVGMIRSLPLRSRVVRELFAPVIKPAPGLAMLLLHSSPMKSLLAGLDKPDRSSNSSAPAMLATVR